MKSGKRPGGKVLSFLLACSMVSGSLLGTTTALAKTESSAATLASQFAMSEINPAAQEAAPAPYSADGEEGGAKGFIQPFIDPSYFMQGEISQSLSRAAESFPSAYDVRDSGEVTSDIRNQAGWGTCWAFAATGAAESSIYPDDETVLSPRYLAYMAYNGTAHPDTPEDGTAGDTFRPYTYSPDEMEGKKYPYYTLGGNSFQSNAIFSRIGAQTEEHVPYPDASYFGQNGLKEEYDADYGDVKEENFFNTPYHLVMSNYVPNKDTKGNLNGDAIKQALVDGYSLTISYLSGSYNAYSYGGRDIVASQYCGPGTLAVNHEVQIVGWDDNIPKEAFQRRNGQMPKNNGGWLIRNSWGDWGNMDGCFYLSYEDNNICDVCQFMISDEQTYDHNYQYDGTGWSTTVGLKDDPTAPVYMSNVFTATSDQTVKAAAFYTTTHGAKYSIQVYTGLKDSGNPTSGTPAFAQEQKGSKQYAGYQTVDLDTPVNVNAGEKFAVVVKMQIPETLDMMWFDKETMYPIACELDGYCDGMHSQAAIDEGQSFISYDGGEWLDLTDYDEPRVGTDGKSEITLANVCLKALTVDGHEGVTPEAVNPLTVTYGRGATLTVDSNVNEVVNGAGFYLGKMVPGDSADLNFVPNGEDREFIGVTVNGKKDSNFAKDSYTYQVKMDADKVALEFAFDTVNKQTLNYTLELAKEAQKSDEYESAVSAIQKKLDTAIASAQKISDGSTATQKEIDAAWGGLIDAIQMLQYQCGDLSVLGTMLGLCATLNEEAYTPESWEAFAAVYEEAQTMYDNDDSIQQEIDEMTEKLADAMNDLVRAADASDLQKLVHAAKAYDPDEYIQDSAWTDFQDILGKAEDLLTAGGTQSAYDTMQTRLALAMTKIRIIPDKSKLQELIDKTASVSDTSVKTAREAVIAAMDADPQTMGVAYYALQDAYEAYLKNASKPDVDDHDTSSGSHGSGSSSGNSSYSGEGYATVGAPAGAVTNVSVVSDTTLPFTLKSSNSYCFKMTVVGSTTAVPSFTVGNGSVLKTEFVAKSGNVYYFRVYAVGAPGASTGVYTTLAGQAPQKHCVVTVG